MPGEIRRLITPATMTYLKAVAAKTTDADKVIFELRR